MSAQALPKDYAAAIYDLALEPWRRQLSSVLKALKADASLRAAMDSSRTSVPDRLGLLQKAIPGGLAPDVRNFLGTLTEAGKLDQIEAILGEFERLARRQPELKRCQVTTAVPLTDAEKETLRTKLEEQFGPDVEFEFNVDASLIGGVHLRIGDRVIDGSVAGKLASLRDRLAA